MQNYEELIKKELVGENPKEKFEYLMEIKKLLQAIAFPRRGASEEDWMIMDVVKVINEKKLIDQHDNYFSDNFK